MSLSRPWKRPGGAISKYRSHSSSISREQDWACRRVIAGRLLAIEFRGFSTRVHQIQSIKCRAIVRSCVTQSVFDRHVSFLLSRPWGRDCSTRDWLYIDNPLCRFLLGFDDHDPTCSAKEMMVFATPLFALEPRAGPRVACRRTGLSSVCNA